VREGESFEITDRGEVVARLVPAQDTPLTDEEINAFWADWDALSAEISAEWPEGVSAEDAINDVRRVLGSPEETGWT
jgi:antitoxin (DNA-binding transcriptional repressor) of toxin-antitoxin stability system